MTMFSDLFAKVGELARRLSLTVIRSTETGSFDDASIELRDGHVLWSIVRERSVLRLEAAPQWDPSLFYDADLLKRFLGYRVEPRRQSAAGSPETLRELMARPLEDLVGELEALRQPVAAAFNESTWDVTRRQLIDLGRRRDAELFGRPYPPPDH
jgi:hypothetical protein